MSLFVTFEGIEGSGKSTHLARLGAHLRGRGVGVVETREPGGTVAGEAVRALLLGAEAVPLTPLAELLLYCADRAQHVHEVVRPALAAGHLVLCDRFSDSTLAYQGYGRGLDLARLRALDAEARDGIVPGLTLLFDCDVEEGLSRARARAGSGDRFEREAVAFHERVRRGFREIARAEPERVRILDSSAPIDAVHAAVVAEIDKRLA